MAVGPFYPELRRRRGETKAAWEQRKAAFWKNRPDVFDLKTGQEINLATGRPFKRRSA